MLFNFLCWALGHRVGPAFLRRHRSDDASIRLLRTSRCVRCGHAFSAEVRAA